jgi:hypothetical protein
LNLNVVEAVFVMMRYLPMCRIFPAANKVQRFAGRFIEEDREGFN